MASEHEGSVRFIGLMEDLSDLESEFGFLRRGALRHSCVGELEDIQSRLDTLSSERERLSDTGEWLEATCSINALSNAVNSALNSLKATM